MSFVAPVRLSITDVLAKAVYKESVKKLAHGSNLKFFNAFRVTLESDVRLLRFVNPTYVNSYSALTKSHPSGSQLESNRYSGKFFDLEGSCGTYFGVAPQQSNKVQASLSQVVQPFGVDFELSHYTTVSSPGKPSALERGVAVHGDRRMDTGRLNPVLGAGGSFFVRYRLKTALSFLSLSFKDPHFLEALDQLGRAPSIAAELPIRYDLSAAFLSDEAKSNRLLHQALAAALYHCRGDLRIDGLITGSVREVPGLKSGDHSVICLWSDDGADLDTLDAEAVSYFDYSETLPRFVTCKVGPGTDFNALRTLAKKANKE